MASHSRVAFPPISTPRFSGAFVILGSAKSIFSDYIVEYQQLTDKFVSYKRGFE